MSSTEPPRLSILTRIVIVVAVLMVVAGVLWYGIAFATIRRLLIQLIERPGGPMSFRFMLQPAMAIIAAILDARRDAQLGRSPYLWAVLHRPEERITRWNEAANATARIVLLGLVMDTIYQVIVFDRFFPVEAVIIALILAFLPYVIARGTALRIVRRWRDHRSAHQT